MEKEKLESLLIDYIDGNLNDAERAVVEKELQNESTSKLYSQLKEVMDMMDSSKAKVPGVSMKQNFEKALQAEISKSESNQWSVSTQTTGKAEKQIFLQPWILRVAAAIVLVIVGVVIGDKINTNRQHAIAIAKLQEEVENNKRMMLSMLENQQSASQRVMGATVAYELPKADDEIVNALSKTLNEDPNTNVRLAALEALGKFYQQEHVRKTLVTSLSTQKDPVVQIALIRLLVQMKEKQIVNELEKITRDGRVMKAVKDEAHSGILKLS
ncbi:MAG TPA: HEAT repeat domain-containing protein [Cyclobacteriaceae bacterium]|jgi:anti-sigma factor RsiW|nr:HEAT repeat domain-containing protein [Cyclobacteriaceae bacterium]